MAEIAEVADDEIVQPDREYGVSAAHRALGVVVEGPDTGHKDLVNLVFAGAAQHDRFAADRLETRVAGVLVRDRHDGSLGLGYGVARFGVRRVGQHDALTPAHAKTSVTEPGQVHGAGRE